MPNDSAGLSSRSTPHDLVGSAPADPCGHAIFQTPPSGAVAHILCIKQHSQELVETFHDGLTKPFQNR